LKDMHFQIVTSAIWSYFESSYRELKGAFNYNAVVNTRFNAKGLYLILYS